MLLEQTCTVLENGVDPVEDGQRTQRKSIVDPMIPKMNGPRTVSTSAKVNHEAVPARTTTVDKFQVNVLGRSKAPRKRKMHSCPVCRQEGHHARTCMSILDEANRVRADAFLKTLVETKKLKPYLKSISSRSDDAFVRAIVQRIRSITEIGVEDII